MQIARTSSKQGSKAAAKQRQGLVIRDKHCADSIALSGSKTMVTLLNVLADSNRVEGNIHTTLTLLITLADSNCRAAHTHRDTGLLLTRTVQLVTVYLPEWPCDDDLWLPYCAVVMSQLHRY